MSWTLAQVHAIVVSCVLFFSVQVRKSVYVYVRAYVNAFTCAYASVEIIW